MSLSYLKPFQVNTSKTQSDQSSKIIFNALSADSSMRSSFNYFLMHRTGNLLTCKSICSFILEISIFLIVPLFGTRGSQAPGTAHLDSGRERNLCTFRELWGRSIKGGVRAELEDVEINCSDLCDPQIPWKTTVAPGGSVPQFEDD